jgi:hypothetical protein
MPVNRPLYNQLMRLRTQMAFAAQNIYNSWEQDEQGMDAELGGGGICDEISRAVGDVVVRNIRNADTTEGGQEGDDHSWLVVYNQQEAYGVDIPCHIYEKGGGYSWQKMQGVHFSPNDIAIWEVPHPEPGW